MKISTVAGILCPYPSAMRIDDRPADGEPNAQTVGLVPHERIEHPIDQVLRNAGAGIADRDDHFAV